MPAPPVQRLVLGAAVGGAAAAPAGAGSRAAAHATQSGAAAEPPRDRLGERRGLFGGRLLGVGGVAARQLAPERAERPPRARQTVAGGAAAGEDEESAVEGVGAAGQRSVQLQQEGAGLQAAAAAQRVETRQPGLAQPRRPPPDLAGELGAAQPPGAARAHRLGEAQLHAARHAAATAGSEASRAPPCGRDRRRSAGRLRTQRVFRTAARPQSSSER